MQFRVFTTLLTWGFCFTNDCFAKWLCVSTFHSIVLLLFGITCSMLNVPKNVLVLSHCSNDATKTKKSDSWFFGISWFSSLAYFWWRPSSAHFSAKKQIKIFTFWLFICEIAIPVRGATATSSCSCGRHRRRRRHLVLLLRRRRGVRWSASGIA